MKAFEMEKRYIKKYIFEAIKSWSTYIQKN